MSPISPIVTPTKLKNFEKIQDLKVEVEKRQNLICTFEDCGELLLVLMLPIEFTDMVHVDLTKELKLYLNFLFSSIESVVMDPNQHYKLNYIFNRFFHTVFKTKNRIKSFLCSFSEGFPKLEYSFEVQHVLHEELLSL